MSGRDAELISHIMVAAARLEQIVEGGRDAFDSSWLARAAAERQLEIIGEAAGKLSQHLAEKRPDLPLARARAMRNFIVHDYDDIDHKLVWDHRRRCPRLGTSVGICICRLAPAVEALPGQTDPPSRFRATIPTQGHTCKHGVNRPLQRSHRASGLSPDRPTAPVPGLGRRDDHRRRAPCFT